MLRLHSVAVIMMVMVMVEMVTSRETAEEARYIYVNTESPFTISALLNVPISLALPILSRYTYRGRALTNQHSDPILTNDLPYDTTLPNNDPDPDLQLFDDPHYADEVSRLKSYFTFLRVKQETCRQRLLCELASRLEEYYPASDIFLRELRPRHGPVLEDERNRFFQYLKASRAGITNDPGYCEALYSSCSVVLNQVFNTEVLKVWQLIGRLLNISFTGF